MLPVIDVGPFLENPDGSSADRIVTRLRDACHDPGFCYIAGHGVPETLDTEILGTTRRFFDLPIDARERLAIVNSRHFRGYTILGDERTRGASDWREQLDIGAEEQPAVVRPGDPVWCRLRGPNQWPSSLPELRSAVLAWMQAMDRVGLGVLRALALGLGQPRQHFDAVLLPRGDPHLKLIRYPSRPPGTPSGQGVGLHQDSGLISFVLQNDVGGLQVEIDGNFVEIEPRPGTYVMNLGEMLQAATSGYLKATPHRVLSPPPGRDRLSVAYFIHPRFETTFEPVELPPALAKLTRGGQNADPNDPIFASFGENYLKVRLRSHPDVARAHYADVI